MRSDRPALRLVLLLVLAGLCGPVSARFAMAVPTDPQPPGDPAPRADLGEDGAAITRPSDPWLQPIELIADLVGKRTMRLSAEGAPELHTIHDIAYVERDGQVVQVDYLAEREDGSLVAHYGERLPGDRPVTHVSEIYAGEWMLVLAGEPRAGEPLGERILRELHPADVALLAERLGHHVPAHATTAAETPAGGGGSWVQVEEVTLQVRPDGLVSVASLTGVGVGHDNTGQPLRVAAVFDECELFLDTTCAENKWFKCNPGSKCPTSPPCSCTGGLCIKWLVPFCAPVTPGCPSPTTCNTGVGRVLCGCR